MHFVDDTDGLVHHAIEGYNPMVERKDLEYPALAHTKCGYLITYEAGIVNAGRYVSTDRPLTCVRCAVDVDDGERDRQAHKQVTFGVMYGRTHAATALLGRPFPKRPPPRYPRLMPALYAKALEHARE